MARWMDPHMDPLRAPTARGQHPHALRSADEVKNPQQMYELRDGSGQYHQQPPQANRLAGPTAPQQSLLAHPVVLIGLGATLAYIMARAFGRDDEPRSNPEPPTVTAPIVAVMPAAVAPQVIAAPTADPLLEAAKVVEARDVSKVKRPKLDKKPRTRRTTQARDPITKAFLPAGTRKRAITEGKKGK